MKKYPKIRFLLHQIKIGLMLIPAFLFGWFAYLFREQIRSKKSNWFLYFFWLMLNDGESNDCGADWFQKEKGYNCTDDDPFFKRVYYFYRWNVFRNGCYNLIRLVIPKTGEKIVKGKTINKPSDSSYWTWRNQTISGTQYVKYKVGDTHYFRYSHTNKVFNIMLGYGNTRLITKLRWSKLKK